MVMTKTTSVDVPKPRTPAERPSSTRVPARLVLMEELAQAGVDPDELGDDWLVARRPSLLDRFLGRA